MIDAGKIAAVLLAAGQSQRFGDADKLLAEIDGEAMVLHVAGRIVDLGPGSKIAVCASDRGPLAESLRARGFVIVVNPHPEQGLSTSLALGVARASRASCHAALIMLGDMPFVGLPHLRALLARFDPEDAPVVASRKGDVPLPPALFARSRFAGLAAGHGDQGGKRLLAGATLVEAPEAELADIDRPQDVDGSDFGV